MKNYITETDLKGYIPELARYLWAGETNYTKQKATAEREVITDLKNKGYDLRKLQVPLTLSSTAQEDTTNRNRLVYTTTAGTGNIVLSGCNTSDGTFTTITTIAITGNVTEQTQLITDYYKYYKVTATGLTGTYLLVESNFDNLFAYKWLEIIMINNSKEDNDRYYKYFEYFRQKYFDELNGMKVGYDIDDSGTILEGENIQSNSIRMLK